MNWFLFLSVLWMGHASVSIFDFQKSSDLTQWRVVNDGVMGGLSEGKFELNANGHAVFTGFVSLENYGGFTSVRYQMNALSVKGKSKVILRLKGDGKNYQFRVKADRSEYYSYITTFSTSGEWEEIDIPLQQLYPSFRGRRLNAPNFSGDYLEEITLLIANKRNEQFQLIMDQISLK